MPRWEPNARERLVTAAMELFEARGYDQTAVADIAARARLTERTFFNCFPDKREVLFHGAEKLEAFIVESVGRAPTTASAIDTVFSVLQEVAHTSDEWEGFADFARRRHALLQLHTELRERELTKLATLGHAMAGALRHRGVSAPAATLAAEIGLTVFKVAFERCMADPKRRKLAFHLGAAIDDLSALQAFREEKGKRRTAGGGRARR